MAVRCVALVFLGPVYGVPPSRALFAAAAFFTGLGASLGGPAVTTLAFKVLESLGLSKPKIGGALSAVLLFLQYTGACLGPLIGGPITGTIGFQGYTLCLALVVALVYGRCAIALMPYAEVGTAFKR